MTTKYTPVLAVTLLTKAIDKGLRVEDHRKGWYGIAGAKGRNCFIPKGAEYVTRVDLSGFVMPDDATGVRFVKKPFACVRQQIDFTQDQAAILDTWDKVLDFQKSLPERPKASPKSAASAPVRMGPPTREELLSSMVSRLTAGGMNTLQAIAQARASLAEQDKKAEDEPAAE